MYCFNMSLMANFQVDYRYWTQLRRMAPPGEGKRSVRHHGDRNIQMRTIKVLDSFEKRAMDYRATAAGTTASQIASSVHDTPSR